MVEYDNKIYRKKNVFFLSFNNNLPFMSDHFTERVSGAKLIQLIILTVKRCHSHEGNISYLIDAAIFRIIYTQTHPRI